MCLPRIDNVVVPPLLNSTGGGELVRMNVSFDPAENMTFPNASDTDDVFLTTELYTMTLKYSLDENTFFDIAFNDMNFTYDEGLLQMTFLTVPG